MLGVAVKTAGDALYIACEMEKRAVKLYERAALIWPDGPIAAAIGDMLSQEREHLRRFTHMLSGRVPEHAEALVLSALLTPPGRRRWPWIATRSLPPHAQPIPRRRPPSWPSPRRKGSTLPP